MPSDVESSESSAVEHLCSPSSARCTPSVVSCIEQSCAVFPYMQKESEKKEVLTKIRDGSLKVVVGTHSLLGNHVRYNNLGLLIVDEEQVRSSGNSSLSVLASTCVPGALCHLVQDCSTLVFLVCCIAEVWSPTEGEDHISKDHGGCSYVICNPNTSNSVPCP